MTGKPVTEEQYEVGIWKTVRTEMFITFLLHYEYLFMSLYRCVSPAPVFHCLLTAETANTVGMAGEVEAGPGQSFS